MVDKIKCKFFSWTTRDRSTRPRLDGSEPPADGRLFGHMYEKHKTVYKRIVHSLSRKLDKEEEEFSKLESE